MKIRIYSDVYNISERIKDIDRDYIIVFDTDRGVYEVHNLSQIGSTYCLTLPYRYLDNRALDEVYHTLSRDVDLIIARMDNENTINEGAEKARTFNKLIELIGR